MENEIFRDRERANEAHYFRHEEAKLLESLRAKAPLDEIAKALGEKLRVDNPELLQHVKDLGLTPENAHALFVAPLIQVAWAEGKITPAELDTVLKLVVARGVAPNTPAYDLLVEWLQERPSDAVFDTAVELIKYGFDVLPPAEREDRIKKIVEACHEVAAASGGGLAAMLGLGSSVSNIEASLLDDIRRTLRQG
jgi:hypothetical protein